MDGERINIIEVGPRDGLQNERRVIPTDVKIQFIDALSQTGLSNIEATSFVSPKAVPQMADRTEVMQCIHRRPTICYSALVPNEMGCRNAINAEVNEVAVLTATSDTFLQKNIRCDIKQSLQRIESIIILAKQQRIPVRAYLSCMVDCPYEGKRPLATTVSIVETLVALGCNRVSLGDTIGTATVNEAQQLIRTLRTVVPLDKISIHFHDTYAQALTNIYVCLVEGVTSIESAVSGLGGCPYAPGAGGNVATEDVVYMLEGLGINTQISLPKLVGAGEIINRFLNQEPHSKVALALLQKAQAAID